MVADAPDSYPCGRAGQGSRGLPRLVGPAAGRVSDGQLRPVDQRWCAIHATHMTEAETAGLARLRRRSPAFARRPKPILATASSRPIASSAPEWCHRHRLRQPYFGDRPPKTCASSNIPNACATAPATSWPDGPGQSTGRRLFDAALGGGAQAMAQPVGAIAPGLRAISACSMPIIPPSSAAPGDAIIDAWIFSGGNACVKDMFIAGRHVVADRRHLHEDKIAKAFAQGSRETAIGSASCRSSSAINR